ncbi:MAG TPA: hypothetical protein VFH26_02810 [Gemmatimonadales bacterium]|nr:hypothetical protein [Gemmatimonadales bacterium]
MDDRFDDLLRDAARGYNDPPEPPRDAMWERIVAERAEKGERAEKPEAKVLPLRPVRSLRYFRVAAGIAAILALGIGLGRLTVSPSPTPAPSQPVASQPAPGTPRANNAAYELATTEYLSQSEAFLTLFRASLRQNSGNGRLAAATARQLLATNRLLLDSPASKDSKTKLLLQDLELVLAQIAQLSPQSRTRDLELITEGLERAAVMTRLRTAVPSGPSTTQGAL